MAITLSWTDKWLWSICPSSHSLVFIPGTVNTDHENPCRFTMLNVCKASFATLISEFLILLLMLMLTSQPPRPHAHLSSDCPALASLSQQDTGL